jgi:hypothetical protein
MIRWSVTLGAMPTHRPGHRLTDRFVLRGILLLALAELLGLAMLASEILVSA